MHTIKLPVEVEQIDTEDGHGSYHAYKLVDADGRTICDTLNSDLQYIEVETDDDGYGRRVDNAGYDHLTFIAKAINAYKGASGSCGVEG